MKDLSILKAGAAPLAIGLALASTPSFAQSAEESISENVIIVTGSRIVRRDLESAAPVAVVSNEEFALSGSVNAEQVLNTLPQVIPGQTAYSNNPGGGVATLDLRGLSSKRNLVLVNGRRWMSYDTDQVVDLNTVPTFLVDSVDVVTGGASAVYGSDAVAGVTNFRLRHVDGVELGMQNSITQRGDGHRLNINGAIGTSFSDGRGKATVFGEYYKRKDIYQGKRSLSEIVLWDDGAGGFIPGGSSTTPFGRFTSTVARADCPTGNVFCTPGAYYESPGVSRSRLPTDLYNYGPVNYLMVPQERYLIGGMAEYEISDGHTAYTEVAFVNNRVATELAATPVTGTFQVDIATVSPFISASDIAALNQLDALAAPGNTVGDGIVPLAVQRRIIETGGRNSLDERNAFRVLTGIKGPISDTWSYDLYYSYARTRNANIQQGNISRSAFQAGLDGSGDPINIFGPGTLTPDMVDSISILAQNGEVSQLSVVSGSISGTLGNLGMGADDIGLALGGEYRKMSSQFIPDTALASGDVIGFNAGEPTEGSYDVKEIFGEVRIPIAAHQPGIHKLELSAAGRYSDYSLANVGGVWTYAGGIEYAPVADITLRGQYQRAVRAPNVGELFGGQSVGFPSATDPCSSRNTTNQTAEVRALCEATGVPAAAVFTPGVQLNSQIQGQFGGNPNLEEEVSDSWTAGVVLRPSFAEGLSLTVDYFNIKVKGAIDTLGGGLNNTMNLCYIQIQDINSQYCQVLLGTRNALGQMDGSVAPSILNANTGKLEVEGIDFQLNYGTNMGFGLMSEESRLSFAFLGTYNKKNRLTPVQELPDQYNECAGYFGILACEEPTPKWKWSSRLSWMDGPLTTSLRWRHLSSVKDDDDGTDYTVEKLGSYDVFDLTLSADVNDNFSVSFGINNLLDKKPTGLGDNQEQANTWPNTYDMLGRDFFVSTSLKF
ncbi:MAG: TonB-dependent receptor domain-containing protein [Sphingomonadaceae bacterium]